MPQTAPKCRAGDTMDTIKLCIHVDTATALREGTGRSGAAEVPLTPEHLGALTPDERATLAGIAVPDHRGGEGIMLRRLDAPERLHLPSTDTSPAAVVAALRAFLVAREDQIAALAAEAEALGEKAVAVEGYGINRSTEIAYGPARTLTAAAPEHPVAASLRRRVAERDVALRAEITAAALAAGPEALVISATRGHRVCDTPAWWRGVPELIALRRAAEARATEKDAEERNARAARIEAEERAAAQKAAREAAVRTALRAYALTVVDLADAAEDGYDVVPGVLDYLAGLVGEAAKAAGATGVEVIRGGSSAWDDLELEERAAPRAEAVKAARALREACARIALPDGVRLDAEKVQRVRRNGRHSTAIVAQLVSEVGQTRVILGALE